MSNKGDRSSSAPLDARVSPISSSPTSSVNDGTDTVRDAHGQLISDDVTSGPSTLMSRRAKRKAGAVQPLEPLRCPFFSSSESAAAGSGNVAQHTMQEPRGTIVADTDAAVCTSPCCEAIASSTMGSSSRSPSIDATSRTRMMSIEMASPVALYSPPTEIGSAGVQGQEHDADILPSGGISRAHGANVRASTGSSDLFAHSRSATLADVSPLSIGGRTESPTKAVYDGLGKSIKEEDLADMKGVEAMTDDGKGIHDSIWPMLPVNLERIRYGFRERYIKRETTTCTFKPRQRTFEEDPLPEGWTKITGPEGFPYFWHAKYQIITDTWIPEPDTYASLLGYVSNILEFMKRHKYTQEANVHLVVDVHQDEDGEWWCGYYFVDHGAFSVFWYEEKPLENREIYEIAAGEMSSGQMKVYAEWEYWKHWCLFPDLCTTPIKVWQMAQNYIRNAQTDALTAQRPTTNHTFQKLQDMMTVLVQARESYMYRAGKEGNDVKLPAEECPWFIGRFMEPLARERFLHFYGERHARIDAKQSVYNEPPRTTLEHTSLLFRILSPLLFCAPENYLKKMEMLWVDRIVSEGPWNHFFDTLHHDWGHQLVYASILLTSNIAFLTVPNVTSEEAVVHGTFVQIPSYVSTIATIGSIILGLALSRQHQSRPRSDKLERSAADEIHDWLMKRRSEKRGLEPLAVMYSLPFALLMWGMGTFLLSFAFMCFTNTTTGAKVFTTLSWSAVLSLMLWFWWMSWDESTNRWASAYHHLRDTVKSCSSSSPFFDKMHPTWDSGRTRGGKGSFDLPTSMVGDGSSVISKVTSGTSRGSRRSKTSHLPQ